MNPTRSPAPPEATFQMVFVTGVMCVVSVSMLRLGVLALEHLLPMMGYDRWDVAPGICCFALGAISAWMFLAMPISVAGVMALAETSSFDPPVPGRGRASLGILMIYAAPVQLLLTFVLGR